MAGCCSSGTPEEDRAQYKLRQDELQGEDGSFGPVPKGKRGCTDAWCLIVLIVAWVAFLVVTFAGFVDGNPWKLAAPRDYQGAYCGVASNWNTDLNLEAQTKLSFTMNVTSTTDIVVKQMMCSSVAQNVLVGSNYKSDNGGLLGVDNGGPGRDAKGEYMCSCCKIPCSKCEGSLQVGGDISTATGMSTISGKLDEMRGVGDPADLFNPAGSNGAFFSDIWAEATKYFNQVCLPSCNENFATMAALTSGSLPDNEKPREYVYNMSADNDLKPFYDAIKDIPATTLQSNGFATTASTSHQALKDTITNSFKFTALPEKQCPYPASKCVPMPGLEFDELTFGYCQFKMAADVVNEVGNAVSDAFVGLGGEAFASSLGETFGKWVGDFMRSLDTFVCVCILAFVVGFVYMVLLRLLVGVCVVLAIFSVFIILFLSGALCYIRSVQCAGAGIFETGQQVAVALGTTAAVAGSNLVNQEEAKSEDLQGDGKGYRGAQWATKTGQMCRPWSEKLYQPVGTCDTCYPDSGLEASAKEIANGATTNSLCRNPYHDADKYKAKTIWCFTSNPEVNWEECTPIGVIAPVCSGGYDISNPDLRKVLEICGYVIWGLAGVYIILVFCLTGRIRLAISVNKVASVFLTNTPYILALPAVQALIASIWTLIWAFSAAFLISQVPDGYTPTQFLANYSVAYGTADTPGVCTDKWPTGFPWKDDDNCQVVDGVISCWRCAPPRYTFDWRFAVSFFVFLWNNALNVAIGQLVVAGAVVTWFFTKNNDKYASGCRSIRTALYNCFRFHLGSVAFGAFIIAVIQFLRYLLKYYEKQAQAQKNRVVQYILMVLQCCLWCFEKCMKFLNKNAYIQIALKGTNFCVSARTAFYLILGNIVTFGVVETLQGAIQYIGIFFITAGTSIIGYFLFAAMHPTEPPVIPLVIYIMMGYVVARLFSNIFDLAVATCLQCLLACKEFGTCASGGEGFVPPQMEFLLKCDERKELSQDDFDKQGEEQTSI